jgi:hypothetical protein
MPADSRDDVNWPLLAGSVAAFVVADTIAPALPDLGHQAQLAYLTLITVPLLTLPVHAVAPACRYATEPILAGVIAGLLAIASMRMGFEETSASLAKLTAATCAGLALARMLRSGAQTIAVAALVSAVDIYSVADGPTRAIVTRNRGEAGDLALNLRAMDSHFVDQIGSSDLLFFALFAAAAYRFGGRRWTTWAAMTASFGLSMLASDEFHTAVPALPLLSAAIVAANADLFLRRPAVRPRH